MRDAPNPRSLEVLGAEVREQLAAQLRHVEALDAKAGVLLGMAGLLVALAPSATTAWVDAGRWAGVVSASLALLAFLPRHPPLVDVRAFRTSYLTADPAFTRLALLDSYLVMLEDAEVVRDQKSRRLMASIAALLVAIMLACVGFVGT